jgi:pimeloyl-ACP methyl ester carboxylesterase
MLEDAIWPKDSQIIGLPSGAQMSYARLGRLKEVGQHWVYFHGTSGSRLGGKAKPKYAENQGVRIITVDRSGYGHSSLHGRRILGFIKDVEHLLDYHGIQEFKMLGVS